MKLLRALVGKTGLALFAIVAQIGVYFLSGMLVDALIDFIPGTIGDVKVSQIIAVVFNYLVALIVIARLSVRDMVPEAKLAWVTLLVFAPLAGSLLYLFFSHNRMSRKKTLLYLDIYTRGKKYTTSTDDCADVLGSYAGHSRYLYNASSAVPHRYSKADFFATGETFFEALVEELEKAEKYILMEYFIIERGVMWDKVESILEEKVKSGVVVKLLYDDIGSLPHIESNFYKKMQEKGIDCLRFNKFTPIASAVHNNRDHRKITVVDGKVGFMGGANLADEYINVTHPLGQWKDSAVRIRGEAVQNLIMLFMSTFDAQDDTRLENYEFYIPEYYEWFDTEGIIQPFGDSPRPLMEDHVGKNCILNMINHAKDYMYITTPYLILDHAIQTALINAAKRGVDVRIITPRVPDKKIVFWITRRNYKPLVKAGIKIYEYLPGFLHAKNYLCDDVEGMIGTINLDYRSLIHHFECGVWMYKTECLKDVKADFEKTFEVCELMTKETIKQTIPKRIVSAVGSIISPML
ncbi:MAG: cardiolipin synthase [Clostridia bacterium]|nr:cardiolipin synthase [Clostridia bacterium]